MGNQQHKPQGPGARLSKNIEEELRHIKPVRVVANKKNSDNTRKKSRMSSITAVLGGFLRTIRESGEDVRSSSQDPPPSPKDALTAAGESSFREQMTAIERQKSLENFESMAQFCEVRH